MDTQEARVDQTACPLVVGNSLPYGQSTWHTSPKGRLVHRLYNPIHGDCAIYFYPWCTWIILKTSARCKRQADDAASG